MKVAVQIRLFWPKQKLQQNSPYKGESSMRNWQPFALRAFVAVALYALVAQAAFGARWTSLGPEGGDARAFAYDPKNPDRIYMGTTAGTPRSGRQSRSR